MVQLFKQAVTVSLRTKDIALAGLQGFLTLHFSIAVAFLRTVIGLGIVAGHQGRHGINAIVGDLALIPFDIALKHSGRSVLGGFQGRSAIDGIGHCPDHFRVSTKSDCADHAALAVVIEHHCIRING